MDRLTEYRDIIQQLLLAYSQYKSAYGDIDTQVSFDLQRDRYQLISIGWESGRRVYGCTIHIDIKDDKIWIQQDGTEVGIANELIERGISSQDIVLGYRTPNSRKYTEFALG
jgi:hypothetical protein